jgi:hypothetical protein
MASPLRFPRNLKPGVRKNWLQLTAGLIWLGVGLMLISFASRWLKPVALPTLLWLILAGCVLAIAIYFFGFSKMAIKNIKRICQLEGEKICLFAFQKWTSYPLVVFMISLGIYLRVYSPIPKPQLAILYLGIGGGLSLSSMRYFVQIAPTFQSKNAR